MPLSLASAVDRRGHALDLPQLRPLLERIIERWVPDQIWLFGSRARGESTETSDWDLLVVVPSHLSEDDLDPVTAWRLQKGSGVRADIIPCRSHDFREDSATPNTLAYEASARGVLLYER